jgi:hypothetical protein
MKSRYHAESAALLEPKFIELSLRTAASFSSVSDAEGAPAATLARSWQQRNTSIDSEQ